MLASLRILVAACCIYIGAAVELDLSSPAWTEHLSPEGKAKCKRTENTALFEVDTSYYARLEAPCPSDGTDEAPLRIQTRLAINSDGPLRGQAGQLTLIWKQGLFSIGVFPGTREKSHQRTAVARWVDGTQRGETISSMELYPDHATAFIRLVVTERDISAWASANGWDWQRLLTMARSGSGFASAPDKIAIGKGWPDAQHGIDLNAEVDIKGKKPSPSIGSYKFLDVRLSNEPASIPSRYPLAYTKAASREDTSEQIRLASIPKQWWLGGPFPARNGNDFTPLGPETKPFSPTDTFTIGNKGPPLKWKEHRIGDAPNEHIIIASSLIPGGPSQIRCAATVIECSEPRLERFLFDGFQRISLYVNAQLIAYERQPNHYAETEADRNIVLAPLSKGKNTIVVVVAGDDKGVATFTLRHDSGDPRHHIALTKRLNQDFPEDGTPINPSLLDSARQWEQFGFVAEAIRTCNEALNLADIPPDQQESSLYDRARYHAMLRDQVAMNGDMEAMKQLWLADVNAKPYAILLRTSLLWQRLLQPDKALTTLREAAKTSGLSDQAAAELAHERLRLVRTSNDAAALTAEMRSIADALPNNSTLRSLLYAELADRLFESDQPGTRELQEALKSSQVRVLRRAAGIARTAKQTADWLAALTSLAAMPNNGALDAALVMLAEARTAQGDDPGAIDAYRQELSRLTNADLATVDKTIASARLAFIRATLTESTTGQRLLSEATKPIDANLQTAAIHLALSSPDQRDNVASALQKGIEDAYQTGQTPEAAALIRLLFRAFPDCWNQCSYIVGKFSVWPTPWLYKDPIIARQVVLWMEAIAPLQNKGKSNAYWLSQLRADIAQSLIQNGEFSVALECLRSGLWVASDPPTQIRYLMGIGDLYLCTGYANQALNYYKQIQQIADLNPPDLNSPNDRVIRQARARYGQLVRLRSIEQHTLISFDALAILRSAQRALEAGNGSESISAHLKNIIGGAGQAVPLPDGRAQGLTWWCSDQMKKLSAADLATYRTQVASSAAQAFQQARLHDDSSALECVARHFPLTSEAGTALALVSRRYLAQGADGLAASTITHLFHEFAIPEPLHGELAVAGFQAAVRSGDRTIFSRLQSELAATTKLLVNGVSVEAKAWVSDLSKQLAAPADPVVNSVVCAVPIQLMAEHIRDSRRFTNDGGPTIHVVPSAGIGNGLAYLHSGAEGILVDQSSGTIRWRTGNERVRGLSKPDPEFPGLADMASLVVGNRCVARVPRNGFWCLEARDSATGRLVWSTEALPALKGLSACSAPASDGSCAIALFSDGSTLRIGAVALNDGHLAWLTTLSMRAADLGFQDRPALGYELAAPTISGRDAFCATDGGAILAIDCGTGCVRWATPYARSPYNDSLNQHALTERLRRPPARVLVGGKSVFVLPRDTLALHCFERHTGSPRWQQEFPNCRALTGIFPSDQGDRVILQGTHVTCLDSTTGNQLWTWQPRDGVTIGCGAVGANSILIATTLSLHRLDAADGRLTNSMSWKSLGVTGAAPGNLHWSGDRLVAVGNGGMVILGQGTKPPPTLPILVRTPVRSGKEAIPTTGIQATKNGDQLALAWRLPCAQIHELFQGVAAKPGELFVRTADALIKLDVGIPAIAWSIAIPSDTSSCMMDSNSILVLSRSASMLIGREDGAMRWCEPVTCINALTQNRYSPKTILGENSILSFIEAYGNRVDLLDRKTGKPMRTISLADPDQRILGAAEFAGKVSLIFRHKGNLFLAQHDLKSGKNLTTTDLNLGTDSVSCSLSPGGTELFLTGSKSAVVDLANGTAKALDIALPLDVTLRRREELVSVWGFSDPWVWALWNPASKTLMYREQVHAGYGRQDGMHVLAYQHSGNRMVRLTNDKEKKPAVVCKTTDGKQLWMTQTSKSPHDRTYLHIDATDTHVYTIYHNRNAEDQRFEIHALEDGKLVNSGMLPARIATHRRGAVLVGNTWVLAGERQVLAFIPATRDAVSHFLDDASGDGAVRYLRGLVRSADTKSTLIPLLREGSWYNHWSLMPPLALGPESILTGTPAEAKAYLAYDQQSLHLAVEVCDSTPVVRPAGSAPMNGDGVQFGISLENRQGQGSVTLLFALHDSDGSAKADVLYGNWVADPSQVGEPIVSITRGVGKQIYLLSIPWGLLKQNQDVRLKSLGMAVIDRSSVGMLGIRTWGLGMCDSMSPLNWPMVALAPAK